MNEPALAGVNLDCPWSRTFYPYDVSIPCRLQPPNKSASTRQRSILPSPLSVSWSFHPNSSSQSLCRCRWGLPAWRPPGERTPLPASTWADPRGPSARSSPLCPAGPGASRWRCLHPSRWTDEQKLSLSWKMFPVGQRACGTCGSSWVPLRQEESDSISWEDYASGVVPGGLLSSSVMCLSRLKMISCSPDSGVWSLRAAGAPSAEQHCADSTCMMTATSSRNSGGDRQAPRGSVSCSAQTFRIKRSRRKTESKSLFVDANLAKKSDSVSD